MYMSSEWPFLRVRPSRYYSAGHGFRRDVGRITAERRDGQRTICAMDKSVYIFVYENLEQKMTSIHYILHILYAWVICAPFNLHR